MEGRTIEESKFKEKYIVIQVFRSGPSDILADEKRRYLFRIDSPGEFRRRNSYHNRNSAMQSNNGFDLFLFVRASAYRYIFCLVLISVIYTGCDRASSIGENEGGAGVYEYSENSSPDGTGKFYMGREIAEGLGHRGAEWMERPSREAQEFPNRVIQALDLHPTSVVADIGTGTGYFAFRIAPKVPYGKVYTVDIDPQMLEYVKQKMEARQVRNIEPVLGTETDPNLPDNVVDVALIVDSYHEFSHPREMMENITKSLKPGGRVVLVEYRGEDNTLPVGPLHRMTQEQATLEMNAVGLSLARKLDYLPQQHILIFEKPVE